MQLPFFLGSLCGISERNANKCAKWPGGFLTSKRVLIYLYENLTDIVILHKSHCFKRVVSVSENRQFKVQYYVNLSKVKESHYIWHCVKHMDWIFIPEWNVCILGLNTCSGLIYNWLTQWEIHIIYFNVQIMCRVCDL